MIEISCLLHIDIEVTFRLFAFPRDDGISFGNRECGELVDEESREVKLLVEIGRCYCVEEEGVEG